MIEIVDVLEGIGYQLAGEDPRHLTNMSRFQEVDMGWFTKPEDAILQYGNVLSSMCAEGSNPNLKLICMDMPRLTNKRVFETHSDTMVSLKLYTVRSFVSFE
jgi:hypothetical protein